MVCVWWCDITSMSIKVFLRGGSMYEDDGVDIPEGERRDGKVMVLVPIAVRNSDFGGYRCRVVDKYGTSVQQTCCRN